MTHAWMFSGDSKEAFKNYTLCSMKANEQKSKYEGELLLQEAWFHLGPVMAFLRCIRMGWLSPGHVLHDLHPHAGSLQVTMHLFLRN